METIQHVLRQADTILTNKAAQIIDDQGIKIRKLEASIEEQRLTIMALNAIIDMAETTTETLIFADRIRQKAMDDAAKVVMADLVPNPTTDYQAQYNRSIATTAHAIRNLK